MEAEERPSECPKCGGRSIWKAAGPGGAHYWHCEDCSWVQPCADAEAPAPEPAGPEERAQAISPCPDCGAEPGEVHHEECDVQQCSVCRGQRLSCDCAGHDPVAARWRGVWPGVVDCRARGWYARLTDQGWVSCAASDPGAHEDLNRWAHWTQAGRDPGAVKGKE